MPQQIKYARLRIVADGIQRQLSADETTWFNIGPPQATADDADFNRGGIADMVHGNDLIERPFPRLASDIGD